ncbi:GTP-binding protein (plasmid) [Sulfitobacter sp. SK012]|uniref:CobW family GTP-binding protein n=1 Tax=Sulfitobacter sp. SK012 TaxID=1389005 RepID=UPI000E0A285A|nr:GTP-binding protein [Sulfitobacter sp. SK012]AXI49120.1 GTP-binding protein [Sulfitobacter sp. SK012]
MKEATEGRLRLTILGGFLGSGKTTWLRHHLHERAFGRVHVIVNEAAAAPVDDALLSAADRLTLLAGACVCCTGQSDFLRVLLGLCDDRSGLADPSMRVENIVLETSGLADPAAILAMIQAHPVLVRQIVVVETIVIVDALNARTQMEQEVLCRQQIEAADRLILTKTDLAAPKDLARLGATLRAIAPGATLSAARFGSPLGLKDPWSDDEPFALPEISEHDSSPINACQLDLGDTPDWTAFTVWLSALLYARGDQIVRVKGVVVTPAGRLLLQTVRRSVQSPEILPESATPVEGDNTIAVIGRGFSQDQLAASFNHFSA